MLLKPICVASLFRELLYNQWLYNIISGNVLKPMFQTTLSGNSNSEHNVLKTIGFATLSKIVLLKPLVFQRVQKQCYGNHCFTTILKIINHWFQNIAKTRVAKQKLIVGI